MELRLYWRIVARRLWLVTVLLAIVSGSTLLSGPRPAQPYAATMRFVVGVRPEPSPGTYYTYDRYYTWLTAEYLLDDLAEVVKSRAFAQDVAQVSGVAVGPGAIQGATSAGKLHRILNVSITWPQAEELARLADAAVEVLLHRSDTYFAQLSTESAVLSLIDPPSIGQVERSLRQRLDLPLRLTLALVAGVALAFLLDYLDETLHSRDDLEALGVRVLGEIPAPRQGLARLWRRRPLP